MFHVPLIDLVSAYHVSRSWNHVVFSSLRHVNKTKPWLLLHTQLQRTMAPYLTTTHTYNTHSHMQIEIRNNRISSFDFLLRSSHSTLLYTFSTSKFFSFDPLHLTWHHMDTPRVWMTDPLLPWLETKMSSPKAPATSKTTRWASRCTTLTLKVETSMRYLLK